MKRWIYVGAAVLVLAGLIGWRLTQKRAEAADQAKQQQARGQSATVVQAAAAKRQDVVKRFEAVGSVEAPLAVEIAPKVSGRLLFLQVREGDRVQAGQVLARVDPAEVQAEVRQKQAVLAQAESRLAEAQLTQNPTNVGVTAEISRQRAALQTAQAQSRQATADVGAQLGAARSAITEAAGRVAAVDADIASAEATIKAAQANFDNARTKLGREEALVKEGATARENVDNARTAVQVQDAMLGEARQKRAAAVAARASAVAQKRATEQQAAIVNNKARADVAAASAGVAQARATLSSARANTARRPAYEQSLLAFRAAVRAAQADVRASEARAGDTVLRAPLTGVVTQRNLDPGGLATPAQPVLSVQDARQVWLTAGVPEEVSRRVFRGQNAQVTFDGLPGQKFAGRVLRINPAADPQSRQFTLRVRLDNKSGAIKPGMFGRVVLETERARQAIVVPKEAVKRDRKTQEATVTVVTADNKAENRPVQTGLDDAKVVVVKSGLREGDKVVILSGRDLKDGQPVRVAALTPSPSPGAAAGKVGKGPAAAGKGSPREKSPAASPTETPSGETSAPLSRCGGSLAHLACGSAGRGAGGEGKR